MLSFVMALLPGGIQRWMRHRLGQTIHPSARIRFGSIIQSPKVHIGADAVIGPFCLVRASELHLGERSRIAPLSVMSAHTVRLGAFCRISPLSVIWGPTNVARSSFVAGRHTQVFPFCWIEPGHGVQLGDRVGIGGHGLIFTHGSWANYLLGAPVAFGSVTIEDRAWLPWRVFVMPGVIIGERAIIAAGSVVTRSIPPGALAGGVPAKVVRESAYDELNLEQRTQRIEGVLSHFLQENSDYSRGQFQIALQESFDLRESVGILLAADVEDGVAQSTRRRGATVLDVTRERAWYAQDDLAGKRFASWLSIYGVRFDEVPRPDLGPKE